MSLRDELKRLLDQLPDEQLVAAKQVLGNLHRQYFRAALEALDRTMVESGRMSVIPKQEYPINTLPIRRLQIPGKPVSETLLEERR